MLKMSLLVFWQLADASQSYLNGEISKRKKALRMFCACTACCQMLVTVNFYCQLSALSRSCITFSSALFEMSSV